MAWDSAAPTEEELKSIKSPRWDDLPPGKPMTREEKLALLKQNRDSGESSEGIGDTAMQAFGNGLSMGYLPNLQALAEKPLAKVYDAINDTDVASTVDDDYVTRRDQWANRQKDLFDKNPKTAVAGNLAGGVVSGLATGPLMKGIGTAGEGASLAAKMAAGGRTGVVFGALANPGDEEGKESGAQIGDRVLNAGFGGAVGASIPLGIEGIRAAGRGAVALAQAVKTGTVKGLDQIQAAADKLGVKLTPGMTSDSHVIKGLESSLEQSPTLGGTLVRGQTEPIREGIAKNVENLVADKTSLSANEAGAKIKSGLLETVDQRLAPSREVFNDVAESTREIGVSPRSLEKVVRNIENLPEVRTGRMSGAMSKASQLIEDLKAARSIDEIKNIRTQIGNQLRDAQANGKAQDVAVLSRLMDKVANFEQSNLVRNGIAQARAGGVPASQATKQTQKLLEDLSGARKSFRTEAQTLRDVADNTGLPKFATKGPSQFTAAVDSLQNEKVVKTLFDTGNFEGLSKFKDAFPQEFELARQSYLAGLANDMSHSGMSGMTNIVGKTKSMAPEVRQLVFGAEGADKLGALKVIKDAFPKMTGPSGTPAGLEYRQTWSPIQQGASLLNYGAYRAMTSGAAQKAAGAVGSVGEMIANSPALKKLSETNPSAFNALIARIHARSQNFTRQEDDPWSRPMPDQR